MVIDQNTISSPQAPPAREEQLKLQQIARISDNVTAPILTLFQISHFQERSQFWQIAATALSAKQANLSESGQKRQFYGKEEDLHEDEEDGGRQRTMLER